MPLTAGSNIKVGALAKALDGNMVEREEVAGMRSYRALRVAASIMMLALLILLNIMVLVLVTDGMRFDQEMIRAKTIISDQRLVTEKTLISLIGGVVAQTAAIVLVIMGYLFPKRSSPLQGPGPPGKALRRSSAVDRDPPPASRSGRPPFPGKSGSPQTSWSWDHWGRG